MKALLSIKPQFVEEIISGNKKFEYRKQVFKKEVDKVLIYSSKPVGRIIGEFNVGDIISSTPIELWEKTKKNSGITKTFFMKYFEGKSNGFAISINDFIEYDTPVNPYKLFYKFTPPQSYKYIDDNEYNFLTSTI